MGPHTGGRYDPVDDTWSPTGDGAGPSPRHRHSSVWTGSEVLIWGGRETVFGNVFGDGARYNPETLEITYRGKNVADVLGMSVDTAAGFLVGALEGVADIVRGDAI